jgi:hypothetical protein
MNTTLAFIKNILPAGKIPGREISYSEVSDLSITIPFAVMGWDEGMDYDAEGNSYQDSPPCEYVDGAFETRAEAEAHIAFRNELPGPGQYHIVENYPENLWAFSNLRWGNMDGVDREAYLALCLTSEDVQQLESRLVREEVVTQYSRYTKVMLS